MIHRYPWNQSLRKRNLIQWTVTTWVLTRPSLVRSTSAMVSPFLFFIIFNLETHTAILKKIALRLGSLCNIYNIQSISIHRIEIWPPIWITIGSGLTIIASHSCMWKRFCVSTWTRGWSIKEQWQFKLDAIFRFGV